MLRCSHRGRVSCSAAPFCRLLTPPVPHREWTGFWAAPSCAQCTPSLTPTINALASTRLCKSGPFRTYLIVDLAHTCTPAPSPRHTPHLNTHFHSPASLSLHFQSPLSFPRLHCHVTVHFGVPSSRALLPVFPPGMNVYSKIP